MVGEEWQNEGTHIQVYQYVWLPPWAQHSAWYGSRGPLLMCVQRLCVLWPHYRWILSSPFSRGGNQGQKRFKKILHDLVVKLKLEFNESFLKLKFGRNRKKNIVVTKQWDDFLIWLQELALQIILNQQIWKCFQRRQQHHNKTKVPKETSVMGTNASLSCLYIIFVWSQRIS